MKEADDITGRLSLLMKSLTQIANMHDMLRRVVCMTRWMVHIVTTIGYSEAL
jgi:hypothetical protein